jgi:excisionase family DNA binding protein
VTQKEQAAGKPFVGISAASQLLGISETTLRRWTDEGRIRVFVTPGGHRRYSANQLRQFVQAHRATHGTASVARHLQETAPVHRTTARADAGSAISTSHLPREAQDHLARSGRQLLDLVIRYVTQPAKRQETIRSAREIGHEHGTILAAQGFSLVDSVEAFVKHRTLLVEAAAQFGRSGHVPSKRAVAAVALVTRVLDEALVALVAAHQDYRPVGPSANRGAPGKMT